MHPAYLPVLFWSLFIFISFLGYGEILRRRINLREFADIGWGLKAAWGMAAVLAIGGVLMALRIARTANLMFIVLFGAAAALYFAARALAASQNPNSNQKTDAPAPAFILHLSAIKLSSLLLYALATFAFAASIAWPLQVDPNDDVVCYLFFPEKILQTGTLIEPFNVRRMGTYGGQSLLQALVMIVGGERSGHVPDRGFGMLMLFGMLMHLSKGVPGSSALFRFLAVGCLFFVSVPRINTGSSLTGAAMILALLLTLSRLPVTAWAGWKSYLAPSLIVAGAAALRPTYLLCSAGIVALEPVIRNLMDSKSRLRALKTAFACVCPVAAGSLFILTPWMLVLWQSNGTPLYPLFPGTMNPDFALLGNKGGAIFDVAHAFAYLSTPEALVFLFCMGLAAFAVNRPLAYAAVAVAVAVSWYTSYKFGVTVLAESYRYTFPMLMPVALWLIISALSRAGKADAPFWYARFSVAIALGLLLALNLPNAARELAVMAKTLPRQIASRDSMVNPTVTNALRMLQNHTPQGSAILVAVDTPYALDFARNRIFTADVPGASSIGRWPLGERPQVLKQYLIKQGIKYIIASDFDNAMLLYTREHWTNHRRPEWFFNEIWRKYFLDFMNNVDAIAKTGRGVATAANLRLIDLNSP